LINKFAVNCRETTAGFGDAEILHAIKKSTLKESQCNLDVR